MAHALTTPEEALALLRSLGAPAHLLRHHELVLEAAQQLMAGFRKLPGRGEPRWREVLVGVALHDAGKIRHPEEMSGGGSQHEPEGEAMLRASGVEPAMARFCRTHASWRGEGTTIEDRLVALSDKLWKGKRETALEALLVDEVAALRGVDRWTLFVPFDSLCEKVAAQGASRLLRSQG